MIRRFTARFAVASATFLLSSSAFAGSLPADYTQLTYLESTGTQYIDTGVVFSNTNGFSITYQTTAIVGNQRFCGSYSTGDSRCTVGGNGGGGASHVYVGWNTVVVPNTSSISDLSMGTVDLNYRNCRFYSCRGVTNSAISAVLATQTSHFCLFAAMGSSGFTYGSCRIMAFRMTAGDNIIMDCVPARRDSDGVLGMYDIVNGTFLTNSGSGTFIAGKAIRKVGTLGYVVLDYLESTGDGNVWGQYVDTGVKFTDDHGWSLTYQNVKPMSFHVFCGSRESGTERCFLGSNSKTTPTATIGWNDVVESGEVNDLCMGTTDVNLYNSRKYNCMGRKSGDVSGGLATQNNTFVLFAYKFGGTVSARGSCRISSFTMTKGNDVIMQLTPIRRLSDGALGMYDIERGKFYPQSGPGEFLAGAPLKTFYAGTVVTFW